MGTKQKQLYPGLYQDSAVGRGEYRKIAIVSSDIKGPISNGGVGTAYASLAERLAGAGHKVTLIFTNPNCLKNHEFHLWQKYYLKKNIKLISMPEPHPVLEGVMPSKLSYGAYLYLKDHHFDIIHFPDMHGLGYYTCLAKSLGMGFEKSLLCIIMHGPSIWHRNYNRALPCSPNEIQNDFLERRAVELCDVVIAPSQYVLNWAVENKWKLPKRVFVEQYPFTDAAKPQYTGGNKNFKEIVFFGRLESRKGLEIFCDVLESLPRTFLNRKKITFLGNFGFTNSQPSQDYLGQRSKKWKFSWQCLSDLGQEEALNYLRSGTCLVVLPSISETLGYTAIECMGAGIPFIAADIPAYRELIHPKLHDKILFQHDVCSFKETLLRSVRAGNPKAKFAQNPEETNKHWTQWHSTVLVSRPLLRNKKKNQKPLVTVCITHRNRPYYLEQALKSLSTQTYENFEVILADDASDLESAQSYLLKLSKGFKKRGWRMIREKVSQGPCTLRNKMAKIAKGEYVLFMDDDNLAKPHELEAFVNAAQITGADVLTCAFDRFESVKSTTGEPIVTRRWIATGDDLATGMFFNTFGDMNSFFKKEIYLKLGGLREVRNTAYEDWEILARAVIKGYKLQFVPEALFYYRDHSHSYSKITNTYDSVRLRLSAYAQMLDRPDFSALITMCSAMRFVMFPDVPNTPESHLIFREHRTDLFDERYHYTDSLFLADSKTQFAKLKALKNIKLKTINNFVTVKSKGKESFFALPHLAFKAKKRLMIEIDLASFDNSKLQIHFRDSSGARTETLRVVERGFTPGFNRIRALVATQGLKGPITISSSDKANYAIRRIEIFGEAK